MIKINRKGDWLRKDAAYSYLRMINAGCPQGGIDVFGRHLAQQTKLYALWRAGKGNYAAFPNPRAPHVRGVAFDTHTTTSGKYDPSAAHVWLTRGGRGSVPSGDEKIRANEFGFFRTVHGRYKERWHFAYDPAKDGRNGFQSRYFKLQQALQAADYKVMADGVFGLETYTVLGKFQKDHAMPVTYVDGPETWAVLNQF